MSRCRVTSSTARTIPTSKVTHLYHCLLDALASKATKRYCMILVESNLHLHDINVLKHCKQGTLAFHKAAKPEMFFNFMLQGRKFGMLGTSAPIRVLLQTSKFTVRSEF